MTCRTTRSDFVPQVPATIRVQCAANNSLPGGTGWQAPIVRGETRYTLRTPAGLRPGRRDCRWQLNLKSKTLSEQDLRDLGFGAVVSRESQQRLLNRDGSFNVERTGSAHSGRRSAPTMPCSRFRGGSSLRPRRLLYLMVNALFAAAYLACGPGALGSERRWHGAPHLSARLLLQRADAFDDRLWAGGSNRDCRQCAGDAGSAGRFDGFCHRDRSAVRAGFRGQLPRCCSAAMP